MTIDGVSMPLRAQKEIMPGALRLSEKGSEIGAEAMNPLYGELLK